MKRIVSSNRSNKLKNTIQSHLEEPVRLISVFVISMSKAESKTKLSKSTL